MPGGKPPQYRRIRTRVMVAGRGIVSIARRSCGCCCVDQKRAVDTQVYDTYEIDRIGRVAFELARKRRNKVTSMEKRNVMKTGVLWNEVVTQTHKAKYSDVKLDHMLADAGGSIGRKRVGGCLQIGLAAQSAFWAEAVLHASQITKRYPSSSRCLATFRNFWIVSARR